MRYEIKSEQAMASFDTLGAQLVSFKNLEGLEYLWQGNSTYWHGQAPILFPIVGGLRNNKAIINGKEYSMPKHGFARNMEMTPELLDEGSIRFTLLADDSTLAQYPFKFKLQVTYTLEAYSLSTEFKVENLGDTPMPFCVGGHPAFNCPLMPGEKFEDYVITFPEKEDANCPVLNMDTALLDFSKRRSVLNEERTIPLKHSIFYTDALVFDDLRSRSVTLSHSQTGRGVRADFPGMQFLGIWSAANDAPFLCLEPWTGMATCEHESDVFEEKIGMQTLAPGSSSTKSFTITLL